MPVNTWGRGRSNRPVVHIRRETGTGLFAKTLCGKYSHNVVDVKVAFVAKCKRCQKILAEEVALANEVIAEVIAEEKKR